MNPLILFAIPVILVIIGMILNSIGLRFDQPASSSEQDAAKRAEAERLSYRQFFDSQRSMFLKRQARVGQYAWVVLVAFVVSFGWIYFDTVNKTTLSTQIAGLQTISTEEGKDLVLSVTLSDGSNARYLVKMTKADGTDGVPAVDTSREKVRSWELSRLGTALSVGENTLPLGVALQISN